MLTPRQITIAVGMLEAHQVTLNPSSTTDHWAAAQWIWDAGVMMMDSEKTAKMLREERNRQMDGIEFVHISDRLSAASLYKFPPGWYRRIHDEYQGPYATELEAHDA